MTPGDDLVPGPHGIPQPAVLRNISVKELDLIVVPGLCFSPACARLGRGAGVYDRLLEGLGSNDGTDLLSPYLLGIAFSIQMVPSIPCSKHDVLLHAVITEKENYAAPVCTAVGS